MGLRVDTRSRDPRYAYTQAFSQQQRGNIAEAVEVLGELIVRYPAYADAYLLLGGIHEQKGNRPEAAEIYERGVAAQVQSRPSPAPAEISIFT
jgi:tetratricopeptide (TPR) repeat protein